ncbi:MAG TPA: hypothetical protein VNC22_12915 [Sporichthya sp.]|jgi:hypothetical protein|nr:hypothetical protein [Sporichthya sp.]
MANRETMRANAAKLLKPGETVQAVIPAQTINPLLYLPLAIMSVVPAILIVLIAKPFRVIVVTDRRILVCRSGTFSSSAVDDVVTELKRKTAIGPPEQDPRLLRMLQGLRFKCKSLGEEPLHIPRRFFADVRAADAQRPGA